jgi:formate dehydrogenase subunit delta
MINQIAQNNRSAGDDNAIADVIHGHISKFWSRRMKQQLIAYIENGGSELHPAAFLAGQRLEVAA